MLAPLHSIRLHWRAVLAVVAFLLAVWIWLPASLRTKLWEGWKKFGHAFGDFQARVLLTVFYYILILPFGLMVRFFADTLNIKRRPAQWSEYPPVASDLEHARRQG